MNQDPCYSECDDCQRHECNMAGECLASDPAKVERKEAYNRYRDGEKTEYHCSATMKILRDFHCEGRFVVVSKRVCGGCQYLYYNQKSNMSISCNDGCMCDPKCSKIISPEQEAAIHNAALDKVMAWYDLADNHVTDNGTCYINLAKLTLYINSIRDGRSE